MADKKSLGKKWGSLKRAARGSVKNLGASPLRTNSGRSFEQFEDEEERTVDDEFTEVQRSPQELVKIKKVCSMIEHFRLQCPQTHAGLVVAFTSATLSPLNDSGIKFKWYRMGGGANNDQFKQIDESPRAWYPPSADDIGKKICANCEDNFDQGYCRYAEAGPVEADPLLISMVESALENGRYEVKDVSFSLGVKSLDPCNMAQNESLDSHSFDMSATQRPSSLVSTDAMTYPFLQFPNNVGLEVNYQGIFVNTTDSVTATTRRGMNILPSADLEMFCTLPASFVIVVALPEELRAMLHKKSSRRNNKNSFSDSDDSEDSEDEEVTLELPNETKEKENNDDTEDLLGLGSSTTEASTPKSTSGYEWIGYSSIDDAANGPGSELCMLLDSFLTTLPGGTTHVRLCFSFADRMSRDAFALSCRVLAGIKPGAGYRDRLCSLPWFSQDGERRTVDVQSIGGNDLGRRLKELEDENATLKRAQNELSLQLLEQSENEVQVSQSTPSVASVSADSEDQGSSSQAVKEMRSKVRELEKDISSYKQKEMEWEKSSLEMESRIKRIQADGVTHTDTIAELHQRISESQAEAGSMRVLSEKYQAEMETMKAQLDTEVTENRAKLEEDVSSMQEKVEKSSKDLKDAQDTLSAKREELEVHRRQAEERAATIAGMKQEMVSLAAAAAEARTMREKFDDQLAESQRELNEMTTNRDNVLKSVDDLNAKVEALKTELSEKDVIISALEDEKNTLLNDSVAPEEFLAMEEKAIRLEGEKNQSEKMTKSLQRDMKKVVKELQHQIWVVEEELARSNERCDELRGVMTQMADDDLKRVEEEEQRKAKSGIVGKMKAVRRLSTLGSNA